MYNNRWMIQVFSIALILAFVLSACATTVSPSAIPPTQVQDQLSTPLSVTNTPGLSVTEVGPTPVPAFVLPEPNPLDVEVTVDENTVFTADLYTDNVNFILEDRFEVNLMLEGPFFFENEDGTLELVQEPAIAVSPITEIKGLPEGLELLVGFSFQPNGLNILSYGSMSIKFPDNLPEDQVIAFTANGDGSDLYFYPFSFMARDEYVDYSYAMMDINHFSYYGLLVGEAPKIVEAGKGIVPKTTIKQAQHKVATLPKPVDYEKCYLTDHWNAMLDKTLAQLSGQSDCKKKKFNDVLLLHQMIQDTGCSAAVSKKESQVVDTALSDLLKCTRDTCNVCLDGTQDPWLPLQLDASSYMLDRMLSAQEEVGGLAPLVNSSALYTAVKKCYEYQGVPFPHLVTGGEIHPGQNVATPIIPKCP